MWNLSRTPWRRRDPSEMFLKWSWSYSSKASTYTCPWRSSLCPECSPQGSVSNVTRHTQENSVSQFLWGLSISLIKHLLCARHCDWSWVCYSERDGILAHRPKDRLLSSYPPAAPTVWTVHVAQEPGLAHCQRWARAWRGASALQCVHTCLPTRGATPWLPGCS